MVNPASSKPDPSKAGKIVSRGNIVLVPISLPSNKFISLCVLLTVCLFSTFLYWF